MENHDEQVGTIVSSLRRELAATQERLVHSLSLLEKSRDVIQQLGRYVSSLEYVCMWSEASWRDFTCEMHSDVLSSFPSALGSSSAASAMPCVSRLRRIKTPLACTLPPAAYEHLLVELDAMHKEAHFVNLTKVHEEAESSRRLSNEIARLKAEVRVERYKLQQREDVRERQTIATLYHSQSVSRCYMRTLDATIDLMFSGVTKRMTIFADACVHSAPSASSSMKAGNTALEYMQTVAARLQEMCLVVGASEVLPNLASDCGSVVAYAAAAAKRGAGGPPDGPVGTSGPSRLELLLMSPGGD
jgi:hypothetical protein